MKIAVLQSNFIPWRGYFHLINSVDKFILYDCVQYTKNDWRNRNKILSKNGLQWLTLQVVKPYSKCSIDKVSVTEKSLSKAILSLEISYKKARTFNVLDKLVLMPMRNSIEQKNLSLSKINEVIIKNISTYYNINTKIISSAQVDSDTFMAIDDKTERLISLITSYGGSSYLSGPSALNYLQGHEYLFKNANIELLLMKYPTYSYYKQFEDVYTDGLSVVDYLAHSGDQKNNLFKLK